VLSDPAAAVSPVAWRPCCSGNARRDRWEEWSQAGPLTPRSPVALPSWATSHEPRVTSHKRPTRSSELRASRLFASEREASTADRQRKSIAELAAWRSAPRVDQCPCLWEQRTGRLGEPPVFDSGPVCCVPRMRMLVLADAGRRWQAILRPAMPFATCWAQISLARCRPSVGNPCAACANSARRHGPTWTYARPGSKQRGYPPARGQEWAVDGPICAWGAGEPLRRLDRALAGSSGKRRRVLPTWDRAAQDHRPYYSSGSCVHGPFRLFCPDADKRDAASSGYGFWDSRPHDDEDEPICWPIGPAAVVWNRRYSGQPSPLMAAVA
jgi:hypothetical protein